MGNTVLQKMVRMRDGLLLLESFETSDFTARQDWDILRGTPVISRDVAIEGVSSFKLDSTRAWIEKTGLDSYFAVGYFYDDPAVVAGGFTPFYEWDTSTPNTYGLGVDLAVSTTHYVRTKNGVSTVTAVARTAGWHRMLIRISFSAGPTILSIDNTTVLTDAGVNDEITDMRVGCRDNAGTTPFGYFDYVQIYRDPQIAILGLPANENQTYAVYEEDDTLIFSGVMVGNQLFNDFFALDGPVRAYVTATIPGSPNPQFVSPVMDMSAGDQWTLQVFDFGRRPTSLTPPPGASRNDIESVSGKNQSSFFNARDRISLTFNDLSEEKKNELIGFWQRVQKGEVVSVAIDSSQTYWSKTTSEFTPFLGGVSVISSTGAGKGTLVRLRAAAGRFMEILTVIGTTPTGLIFAASYGEYEIGSLVASPYYWPFAITTDKSQGLSLSNVKKKRWNVTLNFKEDL